jgi:hypothetical protein
MWIPWQPWQARGFSRVRAARATTTLFVGTASNVCLWHEADVVIDAEHVHS